VSSILEALRELEGDRPPAVRRELPPPEAPSGVARRATGAVIPILGGLAVGVVAFGIYAWGPRIATEPAAVTPAPATPAADAQPAERPNWLDTADAPRAKVGRTATAPAPPATPVLPERAATADRPAAAPAKPASDTVAAEAPPGDETPTQRTDSGASSGGQVAVEKIAYSENAAERVVTMRFKGRRVTLRQREAIDGIEVQLIMPNGVYVQRGTETYLLPLSR
jgi:hypothetical protein